MRKHKKVRLTNNFWLINSNRSRVKRFSKNNQNKDKYFEYMFIDSGRIIGVLGKEPPLMTTREELKVDKARAVSYTHLTLPTI